MPFDPTHRVSRTPGALFHYASMSGLNTAVTWPTSFHTTTACFFRNDFLFFFLLWMMLKCLECVKVCGGCTPCLSPEAHGRHFVLECVTGSAWRGQEIEAHRSQMPKLCCVTTSTPNLKQQFVFFLLTSTVCGLNCNHDEKHYNRTSAPDLAPTQNQKAFLRRGVELKLNCSVLFGGGANFQARKYVNQP